MNPTIGRIVYYTGDRLTGRGPVAAIVTAVFNNETVALTLFPNGLHGLSVQSCTRTNDPDSVEFKDTFDHVGRWYWPPANIGFAQKEKIK